MASSCPPGVLGRTSDTYPPVCDAWRAHRLATPALRCEDGESLTDLHARARVCANFLHHTAQIPAPSWLSPTPSSSVS
ncbi:hypothetical protein [Streptomyces sp. C10]|uniref:hypothetical protein n=1 Tax=Streptomyces sp. C10 TaxID=531941 RepID=UPI0039807D19